MKKTLFSIVAIGFFVTAGTASAQMGMMGGYWQDGSQTQQTQEELNSIVQSIYANQNVSSQAQVDCSKITDDQFEKLGDAYMGVMLPNEQQHEAMDEMMGGEGSASLRQAHINMGRSYLGCWSNYNSGPVYMPMMGGMMGGYNSYGSNGTNYPASGMMGNYGNYGWGSNMMNGYWGFSGFGWVTTILVWGLLALGIAVMIKWLRKS